MSNPTPAEFRQALVVKINVLADENDKLKHDFQVAEKARAEAAAYAARVEEELQAVKKARAEMADAYDHVSTQNADLQIQVRVLGETKAQQEADITQLVAHVESLQARVRALTIGVKGLAASLPE